MPCIGTTDLDVFPLCLGGNVFGWTADEEQSFAVLDAYAAAGGDFIDTADVYPAWAAGNSGGESEAIIGRWMASRGNRADMIVATKVGQLSGREGLAAATVRAAAEDSLRRLGTDHIDLYHAHIDDASTPLEEALGAFDALVSEGKVRHVAASQYGPGRLAEALEVSAREGFAPYVALQTHYNLVEREYEDELAGVCARAGVSCLPFFSLARGFLSGKYRVDGPEVDSPRAGAAGAYLGDGRGPAVLAALDEVAAAHDAPVAAVALAWLAAQPTVAVPVASARTPDQLADLLAMAELTLTGDEIARLSATGA